MICPHFIYGVTYGIYLTHGIYSDIPWGTCPPRYMIVPHGILYTVGNISDVLYGISPQYINGPHGI